MTTPHPTPDTTGLIEPEHWVARGRTACGLAFVFPLRGTDYLADRVTCVPCLQSQLAQAQEALNLSWQFLDKAGAYLAGSYYGCPTVLAGRLAEVRDIALAALSTPKQEG